MKFLSKRFFFSVFLIFISFYIFSQVPHPSEVFGFHPGDDYKLAKYDQMLDYYTQLDAASNRVSMSEIGQSVLGKPLLLLAISSEQNINDLDRFRSISEQLARARIDEDLAEQFIEEGKAIVWIDGGLHATEVACAQMTTLLAYKLATDESQEYRKIRENTIVLLMPVMNPDGLDIVASWYERNRETPFEMTRPPELYHHYVGHDNNRDWFMNNMPESKAVTDVLYNQWYPQIVYNHHQTGPSWTRIFIPPFADPVNPNIHPGVTTSVNIVGSSMANRFAMNEMPGAVSGVIYSMWWNGGMRTVPYFHNMIGILTETSHATPTPRFYHPDSIPSHIAARRGAGHPTNGTNIFYPYPWKGGNSPFSDPIRYMLTASEAVMKSAADLKEQYLRNIYKMGKDAIEGKYLDAPYAYIISPDQWNAGEEINLLNILKLGGIETHTLSEEFIAGDKTYPKGTHIIFSSQAFRPYLVDLLERQEYPDRRVNGQPETPYDLAGWTLPLQMGVEIDRIREPAEIPAIKVTDSVINPDRGALDGTSDIGYLLSSAPNLSYEVVISLLNEGYSVSRIPHAMDLDGEFAPRGSFFISSENAPTTEKIEEIAGNTGLSFKGLEEKPHELIELQKPRIGLYKSWVANMDEGWTRWLLEEYEFEFVSLYNEDMIREDLSQFTAIILPDQSKNAMLHGHEPGTMPEEYTGGLGLEGSLKLRQYAENGGTIIALDEASEFAIDQFSLPVRNPLSSRSSRQFFIPGSLVGIEIENNQPLSFGMQDNAIAYFVRSRAFETIKLSKEGEGGVAELPDAPAPEVNVIAHYAKNDLLKSGWALGEDRYLSGKAAMVSVPVGIGEVVLFGFRPQFRGQPRGTYKLLFNALLK